MVRAFTRKWGDEVTNSRILLSEGCAIMYGGGFC